jgi:hypothetical protein
MAALKIMGGALALAGLASLSSIALADGKQAVATAEQHAMLAAKGNDVAMVHRHLHHVLNCLVGEKGEGFDAAAGNPCAQSGGAIPQTSDNHMKMMLEKAATEARKGISDDDVESAKKVAMQVESELKSN